MKVVYIAGPYRGANSWEMEQNIRRAEALAMAVWQAGLVALCPHTNARYSFGVGPDSMWLDGDIEMMKRCDAVLFTDDWERSEGACTEHGVARECGIPCFFTLEELLLEAAA